MRVFRKPNLLRQVVEEKLAHFDEQFMNSNINFWEFYQAKTLACAILDSPTNKSRLYPLWQEFINDSEEAKMKLRQIVIKDRKEIYAYLKEIEEKIDKDQPKGDLWKPSTWGILGYEYQ